MKDVSDKYPSIRTAHARGVVHADAHTLQRLQNNDLPKKDVLVIARCAGIQAAKHTAQLIPACHPVPIDYCNIEFLCDENAGTITVTAEVKAEYKTGVEMEALTAVSVAALTIYDMLKPVYDDLRITNIILEEKTGGTRTFPKGEGKQRTASVIIVSDSVANGTRKDTSGEIARAFLVGCGFETNEPVAVPDEEERIRQEVECAEKKSKLIILTGGTGPGRRDVTAQTLKSMSNKMLPGIGEWARAYGRTRTPFAILSNSCAGIVNKSLVIALPGNTAGVQESLQALAPVLHHALDMIEGHSHD